LRSLVEYDQRRAVMLEFHSVGAVEEFSGSSSTLLDVNGRQIVLVRFGDAFRAVDNYCTHMGAPLAEGVVSGEEIVCPWHAARFAVQTGEASCGPARCSLPTYPVRIRQGCVEIAVEMQAEKHLFRAPAAEPKKPETVTAA
jgi:nitrite reductase/ring-hydroxylating ferredoxin subunit